MTVSWCDNVNWCPSIVPPHDCIMPLILKSTLFIPTLDTITKFVIQTIWLAEKPSLKRWQLIRNHAGTLLFNTSSYVCFRYLLEPPHRGHSNKYPKHTFFEEIRIKHCICCISFCSLRILYNSKFILMAISLGSNDVLIRGHCTTSHILNSNQAGI